MRWAIRAIQHYCTSNNGVRFYLVLRLQIYKNVNFLTASKYKLLSPSFGQLTAFAAPSDNAEVTALSLCLLPCLCSH